MNYRVSPFNLFSAISLGALIIMLLDPDATSGKRLQEVYFLVPVILVCLTLDYFVVQKYSKNHFLTWVIESMIILIFLIVVSKILY